MFLERVKGIEPSSQAWEAHVLPLNHTRITVGTLLYQGLNRPATVRASARWRPGRTAACPAKRTISRSAALRDGPRQPSVPRHLRMAVEPGASPPRDYSRLREAHRVPFKTAPSFPVAGPAARSYRASPGSFE